MSLVQHAFLDGDLVDVTEPVSPTWARPVDPDWHMDSGEFPIATDPALREPEDGTS